MEFPPSPAASDCDSLDGVDLDAYLALQGPISCLPTPPMDRNVTGTCRLAIEEAENTADNARITALFTNRASNLMRASFVFPPTHAETEHIRHIIGLARWRTSREVCAVAFNILCELQDMTDSNRCRSLSDKPADFLVMCAVQLASDFLEDSPMTNRRWNEEASIDHDQRSWSDQSMLYSKLEMLFAIDWRLHSLSTPKRIEHTLSLFLGQRDIPYHWNMRST